MYLLPPTEWILDWSLVFSQFLNVSKIKQYYIIFNIGLFKEKWIKTLVILDQSNVEQIISDLPVDYSAMHYFQYYNSLCTVFEKVWHFLLQCWLHLMFSNNF